jgi:hemolysin activation/secretion protein
MAARRSSLRGLPAGELVGDQRLLGSVELRMPFSSPLNAVGRTGFNIFFDAGKVAAHGEKITKAELFRGVGGGLFINAAILNLNFEVAHSLDGRGTKFHFGTGFSF